MLLYVLECARLIKVFQRLHARENIRNAVDDTVRVFLQNYRGRIATMQHFKRIFNS